jgi:hypothetical protein
MEADFSLSPRENVANPGGAPSGAIGEGTRQGAEKSDQESG